MKRKRRKIRPEANIYQVVYEELCWNCKNKNNCNNCKRAKKLLNEKYITKNKFSFQEKEKEIKKYMKGEF